MIEEGTLSYLYQKSFKEENSPQPAASLTLLERCINRTKKSEESPTEKEIARVSEEILSLETQALCGERKTSEVNKEIAVLQAKMKELEVTLEEEEKNLKKFFKIKALLDQTTKEIYSSTRRLSAMDEKKLTTGDKKQLNHYLLLRKFLVPSLKGHLEKIAKTVGIKTVIDRALIDELAESA